MIPGVAIGYNKDMVLRLKIKTEKYLSGFFLVSFFLILGGIFFSTSRAQAYSYLYPGINHAPTFTDTLNGDGSITVAFSGGSYTINSAFSYPTTGGWDGFGATPSGAPEENWIVTKNSATQVTAQGDYYQIVRQITKESNRIVVDDTFTNLTSDPIGIITTDYTDVNSENHTTYLCGRIISGAAPLTYSFISYGNPTAFVGIGGARGLGLVAEDDMSRYQGEADDNPANQPFNENSNLELRNKYFGLAGGQSYTMEWSIYPTNTADYFDFINNARSNEGAQINNTIGNFRFLDVYNGDPYMPTDVSGIKTFLKQENIQYVAFDGYKSSTNNLFPEGSNYLGVNSARWAWTSDEIDKIRQTDLNVKILIYYTPYLDNSTNVLTKYDSHSLQHDSSGNPVLEDPSDTSDYWTTPLETNKIGENIMAGTGVLNFVLNHNDTNTGLNGRQFDGIYFDSSRGSANIFTYNSLGQNDYTYKINGTTHKLISPKPDSVHMDSLDFRTTFLNKLRDESYTVISNSPPVTRKELSDGPTGRLAFAETYDPELSARMHLSTPVVLSDPYQPNVQPRTTATVQTEMNQLYSDLRDYGVLQYNYLQPFDWEGNPFQTIYPITPIEIHAGTMIGREKIVTVNPGYYGWGNTSAFVTNIYNNTGHLVSTSRNSVTYQGKTFADLTSLPSGYLAVIENASVIPAAPSRLVIY